MYILEIWPTGMAGVKAAPPEAEGALYVHSSWAPAESYPVRVSRLMCCLQCLTPLVIDGNGLSRQGENLGLRV